MTEAASWRTARTEARNLQAILFSRGYVLPKLLVLIGLSYSVGPWDFIPNRIPVWGHADELGFALLGFALARLLASGELRRGAPHGTPRHHDPALAPPAFASPAFASPAFANSAGFAIQSRFLALRLFVERGIWRARRWWPVAGARLAAKIRAARAAPDLRHAAFGLLGYRAWWALRSIAAPATLDGSHIIVVGGSPRSGTTLLRAVLGRHSMITAGPETTVFLHRVSSPADIGARVGWPAAEIEAWQRDSRSQAAFITRFAAAAMARSGKPVWLEKTPHNVLRFGFVRRRFPQARLVHIVRDGRDVVCSLRREPFAKAEGKPWDSAAAALRCASQWRAAVTAGRRFRTDPRYYELRYEDLVRQPEATLRALLDFLGLPWDDKVLEWSETAGAGDESKAGSRIVETSIGRWRRDLTAEDQAALQLLIGPLVQALGYDRPDWPARSPTG